MQLLPSITFGGLRCFTTLFLLLQYVSAYRPVQHCKTLGDNGHYSACAALTQHYNTTTGESDLYLRYHWYRYRNSKNGWHAFAIGEQMAGSFMLLMYGDPNTPSLPMTVDVRTADGHQPPRPIPEFDRYVGHTPVVEVVTARFQEYKGSLEIEKLHEKPTHVGICEAIIRGYEKWTGAKVANTSLGADMLWSSNYQQNMEDDFSHGRNIDMHSFGLGFGFLYVDLLNAVTPEPMFGPVDELTGLKGVAEVRFPDPPTAEELQAGATYISQYNSDAQEKPKPDVTTSDQAGSNAPTTGQPVEQPVRTVLGKTLRDWMWHLHGLMMTVAFLALYPLGTYLIRAPSTTAFRNHWTVQALATVAMFIGSVIGYINSYGISVKHQYIGIFLTLAVAVQILLGWRHHVQYVATKSKGWLSRGHIILGRIVLPLGYVNIILGMQLRRYGWFTMMLVLALIVLEFAFLTYYLLFVSKKRAASNAVRNNETGPPVGDEAEEYFQLEGEDEFSDSDGEEHTTRTAKDQERLEQAERLRRLDKV